MTYFDPLQRGERLTRALAVDSDGILSDITRLLIDSREAEVYFVPDVREFESQFYMLTDDDVLVNFAMTGEMTGMHKITPTGLETVIEMGPQYNFYFHRNSLPVNGVIDDPGRTPEQLLEDLVGYAYRKAQSAKTSGNMGTDAEYFKIVTHNAIVSRFKLIQLIREEGRVPIPDQNPRVISVKAGKGCIYECAYCDVHVDEKFELYTVGQFEAKLKFIKDNMIKIITENGGSIDQLHYIDEVFIEIADILYLDLYKGGRKDEDLLPENALTSKKAVELVRQYFPWVTNIGTFVGAKSVLEVSRKAKLVFPSQPLHPANYSAKHLEELRDAGLNRGYLGVESGHSYGSDILNKGVSYEENLLVANLIKEAGIGLKAIMQIGVLGNGFYKGGIIAPENFVHWKEAADETARWINAADPYRVMFSTWQNRGDLKINELINDGVIIPYEDPRQFEEERRYIRSRITISRNGKEFIEPDYHQFLKPKGESKLVVIQDS